MEHLSINQSMLFPAASAGVQRSGQVPIDLPCGRVDHDLVDLARRLKGHHLVDIDIVPHGLRGALLGPSHAAATAGVLDDVVAGLELVESMHFGLNHLSIASNVAAV